MDTPSNPKWHSKGCYGQEVSAKGILRTKSRRLHTVGKTRELGLERCVEFCFIPEWGKGNFRQKEKFWVFKPPDLIFDGPTSNIKKWDKKRVPDKQSYNLSQKTSFPHTAAWQVLLWRHFFLLRIQILIISNVNSQGWHMEPQSQSASLFSMMTLQWYSPALPSPQPRVFLSFWHLVSFPL